MTSLSASVTPVVHLPMTPKKQRDACSKGEAFTEKLFLVDLSQHLPAKQNVQAPLMTTVYAIVRTIFTLNPTPGLVCDNDDEGRCVERPFAVKASRQGRHGCRCGGREMSSFELAVEVTPQFCPVGCIAPRLCPCP